MNRLRLLHGRMLGVGGWLRLRVLGVGCDCYRLRLLHGVPHVSVLCDRLFQGLGFRVHCIFVDCSRFMVHVFFVDFLRFGVKGLGFIVFLSAVYCILYIVYCILYTVHCILIFV